MLFRSGRFPGGSAVKNLPANEGDTGSISRSGRSSGEGKGNPLLPGKSHGRRRQEGYSPLCHKRVGHDLVTKLKEEAWQKEGNHPPTMTRLPVQERLLDQVQKADVTREHQLPGSAAVSK